LLPLTLAAYQSLGQEAKALELIAKLPDSLQSPLKDLLSQLLPDKDFIGQWALVEYFRQNNQPYWVLIAAQELHKKWPTSPLAATAFAAQLAGIRQYGAAAKIIEGQKKINPQQRSLLLSFYTQSGQREKAVALAEKILAEQPSQRGLNLLMAEQAMFKGNHAKAGEYYEKELAITPSDPVALNNLVWEYGIVQADFAKAKPYLDRLAGQKIKDARIMDTMGWILAKNGKAAEGAKYIRDALNLVPDHPTYLYHQGWIQAQSGEKEAARESLQSALGSKIPFDERKEAEALLAQQG
jgi:Tfp pilus assembly protein PilF